MGNEELDNGKPCESVKGGYTIFLDEEKISSFMESGDYSSARELDHFNDISTQLEKLVKDGRGASILALSVTKDRLSRDFAVLQMAHLIAKHGKKVLIVDCDFLHPGLSGLVENIDDHGFLDILLYGSSLRSVSRSIGIDGVSVTGPGSFPVSRTIPFAQKEFDKVKDFLGKQSNIVIYCSTLYTEDEAVNPLCRAADEVILCCRIDEMEEGQLKACLADLGADAPPLDLVCFCREKAHVAAAAGEAGGGEPRRDEPDEEEPEEEEPAPGRAFEEQPSEPAGEEEMPQPAYIEKTEEIEEVKQQGRGGINLPRLLTVVIAVFVIVFAAWWIISVRSVRESDETRETSELVQKQREVQREKEEKPAALGTVDSIASAVTGGEPAPGEGTADVKQPEEPSGDRVPGDTAPGREPEAAEMKEAPGGKRYAVHTASFRNIERAYREIEYLEQNGHEARVVEAEVKGSKWFRVLVGEFATEEEAAKARIEILSLRRIGYAKVVEMKED
jgi:septal ring-binding cell division protein DamX